MALLLVLPTAVLLLSAFGSGFWRALLEPAALEALRLSLLTTSLSVLLTLLLGLPVAYLLARYDFPGARLLDTLFTLPIVLPPVVAGVALLLVFGRRGIIGSVLAELGVNLAFTTGAVVLAQLFVAAPFFIRAAKAGFLALRPTLEGASQTLGAGRWRTFWRVSFPLSLPYLFEGLVLAWARALGEFGATIVFAGSLAGRTRTLPLAIYAALEADLEAALALSALLALAAFLLFALVQLTSSRPPREGYDGSA